ncbi:MAG: DUF4296 domain-containing protein [Chitinophagales bacterium]|nr:DUF4296 domain-containing protein [Bacteroidota bacterium]
MACVKKHNTTFTSNLLPKDKMINVLTDVFLMESYINTKVQNTDADSVLLIKKALYAPILKHHKVDSAEFYTTFNFYQSHPKEFVALLQLVDSNLVKIKPLDTTKEKLFVEPPKNIDNFGNYKEQEAAMQKELLRNKGYLLKQKQ